MSAVRDLRTWTPIFAFVAFFTFFALARPSTFFTVGNIQAVLNQEAVLVILAVGLTQTLIVGQFDLSFGAVMSFTGALTAGLATQYASVIGFTPLIGIGVGVLVGFVNALLVELCRVNALVATLAIGSLLDGFTLYYTNGETIFENIPPEFVAISRWSIWGFQGVFFYMLIVCVLFWFLLRFLPIGRYMRATGSNRTAAAIVGVPVRKATFVAFILSGGAAGLAGCLQAARNGSVEPLFGASSLLPAFAAAFLGAATLSRGHFHPWGTFFGAYLVAFGSNGFVILGAPFYTQQLFAGAMLLLATATPGVMQMIRSSLGGHARTHPPGEPPDPPKDARQAATTDAGGGSRRE